MYTTGDLDKSTHKKLMYVGSQHMSGDGNEKRKRCRITNRFKKKKKNYPNSIRFLNANSHMC